jgi:hypothetical protein
MTDLPTTISEDDVTRLKNLKIAIALATSNAERAASELRASQLERQSFIQHLFLQYGLTLSDQIDEQTGAIRRSELGETSEGSDNDNVAE